MTKIKFPKVILLTIIASILVLPQIAFGIAMVTQPIVFKDVLRGSEVIDTLTLINSEDKTVTYQLKAEGGIADWTSFYNIEDRKLENPIEEIQIPAKSKARVRVKFSIPEDVPNGTYTGEVAIYTAPGSTEGKMSVSVNLRIPRKVSISVTDKEILDFETTIIPLTYGMRKNDPLRIKVIYNNQGNVYIKPDIQLKIIQLSTGNVVQSPVIYPYPEGEDPVKPFERKVLDNLIEWPTAGQKNGSYKAEIKVLLDGKVVKEDEFTFTLGFDWSKFFASIAVIGGGNLMLAWFVIGGFFAVLAGILALFYKKPQVFKAGINKIKSLF